AVVSTYPTSDFYDVGELLTAMGTGEAAVTLLSEKGVPTPVVHTRMLAPSSKMAPVADVDAAAKASPLFAKYGARVDAQSAREILAGRLEAAREPAPAPADKPLEHIPAPKLPKAPRRAPAPDPGGIGDFLNSRQGKQIQREVIRGVFGMLKKRL
ncbi:MAG TPA: helicase HerA-like domain-containing protein, partial [Gemmatimonadaceae bacterium]|nr:helicase HerA-like domain-containing protein [Gemmatimonadaceae bacterium]